MAGEEPEGIHDPLKEEPLCKHRATEEHVRDPSLGGRDDSDQGKCGYCAVLGRTG